VAESAPVWPWIALGAGGVLAVGLLGWFLSGGRRRAGEGEEAPQPAIIPASPPPSPVPPPAPPSPAVPAPHDPIGIELRPRLLHLTATDAVLEFELNLTNASAEQADGVRLSLAMVSASPQQDGHSAAFHRAPQLQPMVEPFDLPAGQEGGVAARIALARAQFHIVDVGGRAMFVPLVMVDLRWRSGLSIKRHGADFMVGTVGQGGKLGPIWLDRSRHGGLAASRYLAKQLA
jgi:hypothetical protein